MSPHFRFTAHLTLFAALAALFSAGCSHYSNIQRADHADEVYVSSRADAAGTTRHEIEETVLDDERCSGSLVRHRYFDDDGELEQVVTERTRCGVVELRIVDNMASTTVASRTISRDADRDGSFEFTQDFTGQLASVTH